MVTSLATPVTARALAAASAAGLLVTVIAGVIGHIGSSHGLDPLSVTISDFAISNEGAAIEFGMVALALGSLALLGGVLAAGTRLGWAPVALLLVWTAGLLVAAAVPTDPLDAPAMSTAAYVHRYASVVSFISLPVAAVLMAPRLAADPRWRGVERPLRWLAAGSGILLLALLYVAFPGDRVFMGLTQRVLVGVELVLLAVLVVRLFRIQGGRRSAGAHPVWDGPAEPPPVMAASRQ